MFDPINGSENNWYKLLPQLVTQCSWPNKFDIINKLISKFNNLKYFPVGGNGSKQFRLFQPYREVNFLSLQTRFFAADFSCGKTRAGL